MAAYIFVLIVAQVALQISVQAKETELAFDRFFNVSRDGFFKDIYQKYTYVDQRHENGKASLPTPLRKIVDPLGDVDSLCHGFEQQVRQKGGFQVSKYIFHFTSLMKPKIAIKTFKYFLKLFKLINQLHSSYSTPDINLNVSVYHFYVF